LFIYNFYTFVKIIKIRLGLKDSIFSENFTINLQGNLVDMSTCKIMGILNVTPDSFYDGGRYFSIENIEHQVEKMILEGADFIDVGGYSSRPGAKDISEKEEKKRVSKAIKVIKKSFPDVFISVDTFRSVVAEAALDEGACMINDISGGTLDNNMYNLVANRQLPYILMHMKGTPQTMKTQNNYDNMLIDLLSYFNIKIEKLKKMGVKDIIIDPGFGFAKNIRQNFLLLKNLAYFKALDRPVLVGVSRKSMIYKSLGVEPEQALNGTTVLNTFAIQNKASILRVHDVKEAVECVKLYNLYNS
jgi:dihydropteroate synthase